MKKLLLALIYVVVSGNVASESNPEGKVSLCKRPNYAEMSHENCLKALDNITDGIRAYLRIDYAKTPEQNYAKALRLFRPLITQGNADAQYHLAQMYTSSLGVSRDYPKQ